MVAFDNMQNRSIKGTSGWQEYEVVLDVPQDAKVVGPEVLPTGAQTMPDEPTNFDFTNSGVDLGIPKTEI